MPRPTLDVPSPNAVHQAYRYEERGKIPLRSQELFRQFMCVPHPWPNVLQVDYEHEFIVKSQGRWQSMVCLFTFPHSPEMNLHLERDQPNG
ncbi:hypothetical protein pdam_00020327 [Pocillopora damicornis]|uniref:Uncharacterized protein n=1 Tax=Pocillopora damicornis TaxID=46731 RepID=A0A3M6T7L9_POCDA|nr:hypothetical protein pdam_00020327 [Pocillopora damicornis]